MTKLPLILASKSLARAAMLRNAGLAFDVAPADIDEESIRKNLLGNNTPPQNIVMKLAEEKAVFTSKKNSGKIVIGSDQILVLGNKMISKSGNKEEARRTLKELRGKNHNLISAACVSRDGDILWKESSTTLMKMKSFDDKFLDAYLEKAGDTITNCVGCYALEGLGSWLFEEIEGDYFTVLGMPLLPLLSFLETQGFQP